MSQLWSDVDEYINNLLIPDDAILDNVLKSSAKAGLPPHNVSPAQGKFLQILAKSINAYNILEVGTLGGYSAIWLARELPNDGKLITLEFNPEYIKVAQSNIVYAG